MKRRRVEGAGTSKGRTRGGAASHLTDEDQALWDLFAQELEPLRKGKPRVPRASEGTEATAGGASRGGRDAVFDAAPAGPRAKVPAGTNVRPVAAPVPVKSPPPLQRFDKKRQRRIASGQLEIEARLDLHGHRQSDAHQRLRDFLLRGAAKGYATVLVVTGKGGQRAAKADALASPYGQEQRGVLRRLVPLWLEEADLRAIVASFTTASIAHGGEGALYIHLRRARTPR